MKKVIPVIIIVLVAITGFFVYQSYQKVDFTLNDERTKGNPQARVVVIEYVDFQCPSCAYLQSSWVQVWGLVKSDVRLIFRHFPLPGHPHAKEASVFVEAANLQGKFWEMHDVILAKQSEWSGLSTPMVKETFSLYASQLGLDMNQLATDLKEKRDLFLQKIERDIKSGKDAGVQGTPSLFINNERARNPRDAKDLLDLLRSYVNRI